MKMGPGGRYTLYAIPVMIAAIAIVAIAAAQVIQGKTNGTTSTAMGSLTANFNIGPIQPVCYSNSTTGPAGSSWTSVKAVVTFGGGFSETIAVPWQSNGCYVTGSLTTALTPGTYSVSLTSCCGVRSGIPKSFTITADRTTTLEVNVDTGIR